MGTVLTANVVVTEPGSADPVVLPAGAPLPEWAADQVGAHVVEDDGTDENSDAGSEAPVKTRRRRSTSDSTDGGSS